MATWALLLLLLHAASAFMTCDDGSLCPTNNTCCFVGSETRCVTHKHDDEGPAVCCQDVVGTACPSGYQCQDGGYYCKQRKASVDPQRLPRYQACRLPREAYEHIHGFLVASNDTDTKHHRLAYLSNMGALDASDGPTVQKHLQVKTLVVVVHGSARNPDDYLCGMQAALAANDTTTMVVAPWFLGRDDDLQGGHWSYQEDPLRWTDDVFSNPWRFGGDAIDTRISSFAALDQFLNHLVQGQVRFPHLGHVVVTGHSAGGQYVQRWALLSRSLAFDAPRYIATRVVVANPKSYSFLDHRRYVNGTLTRPPPEIVDVCPHYNDWWWGMEQNYVTVPYFSDTLNEAGGAKRLHREFGRRTVIYLSGEQDVLENGECMDQLQGRNRFERSENFFNSLEEVFGLPVHHRSVVPHVNHDHRLMYQSQEGKDALFGYVE